MVAKPIASPQPPPKVFLRFLDSLKVVVDSLPFLELRTSHREVVSLLHLTSHKEVVSQDLEASPGSEVAWV